MSRDVRAALHSACVLLVIAAASACEHSSTFSSSITFRGTVYTGHRDQASGSPVIDGAASGAVVSCAGYPGNAVVQPDGRYALSVPAVRQFRGNDTDSFTIEASGQGLNEAITVYGKPGDTVTVRDIVLYQHTEE